MFRVALKRNCGCYLFGEREQKGSVSVPEELFSRFECEHTRGQTEMITTFALVSFCQNTRTFWYYESEKGLVQ